MNKILTVLLLGAFAVSAHAAPKQGDNEKSAALLAGRSGKTVHLYDYETPDGTYSASLYPSSVKNLGNGWYSTVTLHQPAHAGKHAHMLILDWVHCQEPKQSVMSAIALFGKNGKLEERADIHDYDSPEKMPQEVIEQVQKEDSEEAMHSGKMVETVCQRVK